MEEEFSTNEINLLYKSINKDDKIQKRKQIKIYLFLLFLIIAKIVLKLNLKKTQIIKTNYIYAEKPVIGEIICLYDFGNETKNATLLGKHFSIESDFGIFIDEEEIINFSPNYTLFNFTGEHTVLIKLYENINMACLKILKIKFQSK